jgi:hypothetical protein
MAGSAEKTASLELVAAPAIEKRIFPGDFMFQLRKDEAAALRSQIATSNAGRGAKSRHS